jgi:hypothetical protein
LPIRVTSHRELYVSSFAGGWEVNISKFGSQFVWFTALFSAFLILVGQGALDRAADTTHSLKTQGPNLKQRHLHIFYSIFRLANCSISLC